MASRSVLSRRAALIAVLIAAATAVPLGALDWKQYESSAHGFPAMRDLEGARIADGEFAQWTSGGRLHVRIVYSFADGHRGEERVVLRQRPGLQQDAWSWRETRGRAVLREFTVDLTSGHATASVMDEGERKEWSETLEIEEPASTFAGFGFTIALKAIRARLLKGETVTLHGVGFMPKPQLGEVEVSHVGRDQLRMAGRTIAGDRFLVHPKIPLIARLFVKVPDATIWLTTPPVGFLRWQGPLALPDDPMIRVDLLP
jgi:hypothetical protein